jgi:DNA topoisomerase-1
MLRQSSKDDDNQDRTVEVASAIAEEGLRYVSDAAPGYRRKRTGTSFTYYDNKFEHVILFAAPLPELPPGWRRT